jgi:hypothetical protein
MRLSSLFGAIRLIQMRDKRWVPEEFRGISFFGSMDEWQYEASEASNMCQDCEEYNGRVFVGYELRREFPYMEVVNVNMIYPRVHPNCNCMLVRVTKYYEKGEEI